MQLFASYIRAVGVVLALFIAISVVSAMPPAIDVVARDGKRYERSLQFSSDISGFLVNSRRALEPRREQHVEAPGYHHHVEASGNVYAEAPRERHAKASRE